MYRLIAASVLTLALVLQAFGIAAAFDRSLDQLREDRYNVDKSLGNLNVPLQPGLDARITEYTPPEYLSPIPPRPRVSMCQVSCGTCNDGCAWNWRSNCFGDNCPGQFAYCMASCWERFCKGCEFDEFEEREMGAFKGYFK